ncbi:MAG: NADH-quinone oxidoreductase subunit M [Bacteroidetes bacterium]|nr:NADH-quinone oxidoreductase subunit M [Bacteroidota bacterium]
MLPIITLGLPLAASIMVLFLKKKQIVKQFSLVLSVIIFITTLFYYPFFYNLTSDLPIKITDTLLSFSMDGLSYLMLLLTSFASMLIVATSFIENQERSNIFYSLFFLTIFALTGVFTTQNSLMFYIYWELALIPVYFMCGFWGGKGCEKITIKFFIYTLFGSLIMLSALIYLYVKTPYPHSFNFEVIYKVVLSGSEQSWIFWAFFIAFAVKIPIFPFHTWQPDTYTVAPMSVTMILAGIMLKMGVYGIIRLMLPITHLAMIQWGGFASILAVIGIVYASIIAITQTDIKRLFAYSSMAHVGLLVVAAFSMNKIAIQGVVFQMLSHGVNIIGLFFVAEIFNVRIGSQKIGNMGGIAKIAPKFATFFIIIMLASIALPLTNGFVGEFLMLLGIFQTNFWFAILAGSGIIFGAVYMLWLYQRTMYGKINENISSFADLTINEILIFSTITIVILGMGLFPSSLLNIAEPTINQILKIN